MTIFLHLQLSTYNKILLLLYIIGLLKIHRIKKSMITKRSIHYHRKLLIIWKFKIEDIKVCQSALWEPFYVTKAREIIVLLINSYFPTRKKCWIWNKYFLFWKTSLVFDVFNAQTVDERIIFPIISHGTCWKVMMDFNKIHCLLLPKRNVFASYELHGERKNSWVNRSIDFHLFLNMSSSNE